MLYIKMLQKTYKRLNIKDSIWFAYKIMLSQLIIVD